MKGDMCTYPQSHFFDTIFGMNFDAVKPKIAELAKKYGLTLVVLFGSQATGQTHKESDVDVAYMSEKKLSFDDEALLNFNMTEIFHNDKVSLVNMKTASPLLLKQVVTDAVVLYERTPHLFIEMFLYALRVYEEARPIFELRDAYLERRISEYKIQISEYLKKSG